MRRVNIFFSSLLRSLCAFLLFLSVPALADPPASTIERIRKEGIIRIGYGAVPPFSYRAANGEVTGYSVEICKLVAEDLREQLGLERLDILYVARTPIDRVQLLNEGHYDLECDASSNTEERRRSVAFASSHFFTVSRFVSLAKNDLRTMDDLKGRSVAAALGTVNIAQVGIINRERQLLLAVVPETSLHSAFNLVTTGQASAFIMDEILLRAMMKETGYASRYRLSDDIVAEMLPYGMMMRKDDLPFHSAVNAALARIYASPRIDQLYRRWFQDTVPGYSFSMDVPMSEELSRHFATFR